MSGSASSWTIIMGKLIVAEGSGDGPVGLGDV
jgi:hypothetical protein